jgi:hypothetical protein
MSLALVLYTGPPIPPILATVYTQVLKNAKGRYTGPPGPPILGGNNRSFCVSPPRIGGSGGLMQGVQKKSYLHVHPKATGGGHYP